MGQKGKKKITQSNLLKRKSELHGSHGLPREGMVFEKEKGG